MQVYCRVTCVLPCHSNKTENTISRVGLLAANCCLGNQCRLQKHTHLHCYIITFQLLPFLMITESIQIEGRTCPFEKLRGVRDVIQLLLKSIHICSKFLDNIYI